MTAEELLPILSSIKGCTFASIDSETVVKSLKRVETGSRVLVFNSETSGYERMVKRRLKQSGKNPQDFVLSDLPWGERVPGTPLISHRDRLYLQVVLLSEGATSYYLGKTEVNPLDFGIKPRRTNQGLEAGNEVLVNTYNLNSITGLRIFRQAFSRI